MQQGAGHRPVPRFAIFTDFDGTLVEIAERPSDIVVPDDLAQLIVEAGTYVDGALAVISGRQLDDVAQYLPEGIAIAGGHGTERRRADGERIEAMPAWRHRAEAIAAHLAPLVKREPRLILEQKPSAVALHFRQAPELETTCFAAMSQALLGDDSFELLEGKMVIEARPRGTSKANALRAFMQEAPFAGRIPVFFGDDATDEDGFQAAQELGGVGVKVGAGNTVAKVRTADVESARITLFGLAQRVAAAETGH